MIVRLHESRFDEKHLPIRKSAERRGSHDVTGVRFQSGEVQVASGGNRRRADRWRSSSDLESKCGVGGGGDVGRRTTGSPSAG